MPERVKLPTYKTQLIEAIRSLAVDSGIVSSVVHKGSNTLTDSTKDWPNGVHKNRLVKIVGDVAAGAGQIAVIANNSRNTLVIKGGWFRAIGAGAVYIILGIDAAQVLRDVFNAGFDISAEHPLETHDPKVEEVEAKLDDPVSGLGALKELMDDIEAKLDDGGFGLAAIVNEIDENEAKIETVDTKTSHTEDTASGDSGGDGAWHDALDIDTRGVKGFSAVVKNTDGANSFNWRLRARPSNYSTGVDEEIPECPGSETLVPIEKGLAELVKTYSRIKIQVQDTIPASAATYTIDYLINR